MLIYVGELLLSNQNRIVYSGDTLHATLTCPPHSRYGAGIQVPSLWKLHPGSSSATKRLVSPANLKGRSKLPFDPPKLGGFHRFTNTKLVYPESTLWSGDQTMNEPRAKCGQTKCTCNAISKSACFARQNG